MAPVGRWVRTDEAEDVSASIRHALRTRQFIETDDQAWKWVALALHAALQGACVCHVITSLVPLGAVTKRNAGEWLAYFEQSRERPADKPPKTYLLPFPDLLKAVRKPHSAGDRSNVAGVYISDSEYDWLLRFHEDIRNQFVHFAPQGWSIEVSGIPELGMLVGRIIVDIMELGWAFRHKERDWQNSLRKDVASLSAADWLLR